MEPPPPPELPPPEPPLPATPPTVVAPAPWELRPFPDLDVALELDPAAWVPEPPSRAGRRPLVAAGVAGAVCLAVVASLLASRGARQSTAQDSTPPADVSSAPPDTGLAPELADSANSWQGSSTLVYTDAGIGLRVAPPGGAARSYVAVATLSGRPPLRVGQSLVYIAGGAAFAADARGLGPARQLGPADYLFPAAASGFVGLGRALASGGDGAEVVPVAGAVPGRPVVLPPSYVAAGQVSAGYVLIQGSGASQLQIWRPPASGTGAGTVVRSLGAASGVLSIHGDLVAWTAWDGCHNEGECALHITDSTTGVDQVIVPVAGHRGFLPGGAFSPDGTTLATFVSEPLGAHLVLVYVQATGVAPAGATQLVAGGLVQVENPAATAVWNPGGDRLFFCGDNGTMHALGTREAVAHTIDQVSSSTFAVF